MHSDCVTTPFGRRSMTLAMFSTQIEAANIDQDKCVDKWKLFRMIYEARQTLGVSDRSLTVLNALLSFYPKNELSNEAGLVVFPSNTQLSLRTHGMAGTTLRRHLSALVDAGLIIRRDSPNGKRYARRAKSGDIRDAFGFNLAPLVVRAEEIERLAEELQARREQLRSSKEQVSLVRRDITKLIDTALDAAMPGDWLAIRAGFQLILLSLPRTPDLTELTQVLRQLEALRSDIVNQLKKLHKTPELDASESQNGAHIQNTKIDSIIESKTDTATPEPSTEAPSESEHIPAVPTLAVVLKACPEITAYGPSGAVTNWSDFLAAASVVHRMFAITPSAYQRACLILGVKGAAIALACILERSAEIQSPGAYLTALTQRAPQHRFSLMAMVNALIRRRAGQASVAALDRNEVEAEHLKETNLRVSELANNLSAIIPGAMARVMPRTVFPASFAQRTDHQNGLCTPSRTFSGWNGGTAKR